MRRGRSERPLSAAPLVRSGPSITDRSDRELVVAARDGDRTAFEDLYTRHVSAVEAVCRRRLGRSDDLADAVQETFLRAGSRLSELRDADRVGPWLKQIAASICVDAHRRGRTTPHDSADLVFEQGLDAPRSVVEQPDDIVVAAADADVLREHLARLGTRDRQALWLRDALGVPVPDVAHELGVTEGSARVLLTRARKRLRSSFSGVSAVVVGLRLRLEQAARFVADHPAVVAAPAAIVAATFVLLPPAGDAPAARGTIGGPAEAPPAVSDRAVEPSTDVEPLRQGSEGSGAAGPSDGGPGSTAPRSPEPPLRIGPDQPEGPKSVAVGASDDDGDLAEVEVWSGELLEDVPPVGDIEPAPVPASGERVGALP